MIRRVAVLCVASAIACFAQQPTITNANVHQASAADGLEAAIRTAAKGAAGPAWIGYAAPAIRGDYNNGCCWSDSGRGCGLEGGTVTIASSATQSTPVRLEGPSHVVVLLRYEQEVPEKLRVFSPDCPLDAGGLPFYWLSNVKPAESVAMLTNWLKTRQENNRRGGGTETAVQAIALHAGPEAEAALTQFANASTSEQSRRSALFWLARSRGKSGYDVVAKTATADESEKVREHAIFALTQSKQPEAIPAVIRIAREDKSPEVRKRAMFWLGQSRDRRALEFFEQVLTK